MRDHCAVPSARSASVSSSNPQPNSGRPPNDRTITQPFHEEPSWPSRPSPTRAAVRGSSSSSSPTPTSRLLCARREAALASLEPLAAHDGVHDLFTAGRWRRRSCGHTFSAAPRAPTMHCTWYSLGFAEGIPLTRGEVRHGIRLEVAYFDQERERLPEDATVADAVLDGRDHLTVGGEPVHVFGYLRDFLFSARRARDPVRALSGGERNRRFSGAAVRAPANFLVLDEPTKPPRTGAHAAEDPMAPSSAPCGRARPGISRARSPRMERCALPPPCPTPAPRGARADPPPAGRLPGWRSPPACRTRSSRARCPA